MKISLAYSEFDHTLSSLQYTVTELDSIIEVDQLSDSSAREREILLIYRDLLEKSHEGMELDDNFVQSICRHLDQLYNLFLENHREQAARIIQLRLAWDGESPHAWNELGKILYLQFLTREEDNAEKIIHIFQHVIELVEKYDTYHDMGFWAYSYMANLHLYRILSGEEALVQAMKNYNMAYRFSQTYDITAHEDFIFDDLEILQNILMNRYPLLVLIYNDSGVSLFEYLFQFVEVITAEQRFIPNFTALMSVVDERMFEIFNSNITTAYLVLENRLMVVTNLYQKSKAKWIKIAFIFSYVQQDEEEMEIDQEILSRVKVMKEQLLQSESVMEHLKNFGGRHNIEVSIEIEDLLQDVFASSESE
ncbi:MAG: hypothetical protein ACXAE3_15330 [Candidatus Kariarchaeaceae archaeon]|jgi:hypothetical protein